MSFHRLYIAALLLAATCAQAGDKQTAAARELKVECVPASRATELNGQHGCIAGKVFRVAMSKNGNQHISLCPARSGCSFNAAISRHDHDKVGDVTYLRGKYVALVGNVMDFRGHPRMIIKDREQIHVTADNPPGEFDPAQPRAAARNGQTSKSYRAW